MNRVLLVAAVFAAFTAGVHLFVRTPEITTPLLHSSFAPELSYLLYACWHLVSCSLALSAFTLFVCALPRHHQSVHAMAVFISCLWLSFGLVFVAVGLLGAGGTLLFKLPQWILLLPVGALGLWGGFVTAGRNRSSTTPGHTRARCRIGNQRE